MIFRSIDGVGDWLLGKGKSSYQYNNGAIALNIQTTLLSFLNDCFFDTQAGIDWIRLLGTKATENEIKLSVRAAILKCYGVVRVNSVNIYYNGNTRNLNLSYNIDSIFTSQYQQSLAVLTP
jgi:hypothetical protein